MGRKGEGFTGTTIKDTLRNTRGLETGGGCRGVWKGGKAENCT